MLETNMIYGGISRFQIFIAELGTEPEPNPEPRFLRRTEPELEPKNLEPEPNRNPKISKEPNPKEPGFFWVLFDSSQLNFFLNFH